MVNWGGRGEDHHTRRFDSIKGIYDGFLKNLIRKDFSIEGAVATANDFFGSERAAFAAVDGTLASIHQEGSFLYVFANLLPTALVEFNVDLRAHVPFLYWSIYLFSTVRTLHCSHISLR